jgi:hypothetical protein
MAIEEYVVGQYVKFIGSFWDDAAHTTPIDPTTVEFVVTPPDGTNVTDEDPYHESTGVFSTSVLVDQQGDWHYEWRSTSPTTVIPGVITVYASRIAA